MINKKLTTLFLLVFLVSIVSATTLTDYKSQRVDEEFNFTQTCYDATYITLSTILTPNSTEIININMTSTGEGSFEYNYTPTQIGRYDFVGISDGCSNTFAVYVDVTANGQVYDTGDSLIYIFVGLFFIAMMIGFHKIAKSVDFEKWYEGIKEKYAARNAVKFSLAAIAYNIMKNGLIVYFLLGLPIILMLNDLVFIYNVTGIQLYMQTLLYLYIFLIVILGIVFLGYLQEWFMDLIESVQNTDWGLEDDR